MRNSFLVLGMLLVSGCSLTPVKEELPDVRPVPKCISIVISPELLSVEQLSPPIPKEQFMKLTDAGKIAYLTNYLLDTMGKYKQCKSNLEGVKEVIESYEKNLVQSNN